MPQINADFVERTTDGLGWTQIKNEDGGLWIEGGKNIQPPTFQEQKFANLTANYRIHSNFQRGQTPTAFHHPAQGWREARTPTLGTGRQHPSTLKALYQFSPKHRPQIRDSEFALHDPPCAPTAQRPVGRLPAGCALRNQTADDAK